MTNEEKAREICSRNADKCVNDCHNCVNQFELANIIEMAEWKDEQHTEEKRQWVEKACEWLKDNIHDYYVTCEFEEWFDDMFDDFKKVMKGGEE